MGRAFRRQRWGASSQRRAAMSSAPPTPLVVVLCGPTGAGKSALAVDLARALGSGDGEVINADALQLHESMPIVTARVTESETKGVPHHLLGAIKPGECCDVHSFCDLAVPIVRECIGRGKNVVIVGGTTYYAQALVSDSLVVVPTSHKRDTLEDDFRDDLSGSQGGRCISARQEAEVLDSFSAHRRLEEVDPESAARLHPNDIRRVRRYLEIYDQTGVQPSVIFTEKRTMKKFKSRFDELGCQTVFIALKCDPDVLDRVLHARVDSMVARGVIDEIEDFARKFGIDSAEDESGDVRQAIGYSEWKPYLRAKFDECNASTQGVDFESMAKEAVEMMKRHTCKLARRQRARLETFAHKYAWPVKYIDVTAVLRAHMDNSAEFAKIWQSRIVDVAVDMAKEAQTRVETTSDEDFGADDAPKTAWIARTCEDCRKTFRGDHDWMSHVSSKRHRKAAATRRKLERGELGSRHPKRSNIEVDTGKL